MRSASTGTPTATLMLHTPTCGLSSVCPANSARCTGTVSASAARSSVPSTRKRAPARHAQISWAVATCTAPSRATLEVVRLV